MGKAAASSVMLAFTETTPVNTTSLGHLEKHSQQVSKNLFLCRPTTVCVYPMKDETNALGIFQHGSRLRGFQLLRNSRKKPLAANILKNKAAEMFRAHCVY